MTAAPERRRGVAPTGAERIKNIGISEDPEWEGNTTTPTPHRQMQRSLALHA